MSHIPVTEHNVLPSTGSVRQLKQSCKNCWRHSHKPKNVWLKESLRSATWTLFETILKQTILRLLRHAVNVHFAMKYIKHLIKCLESCKNTCQAIFCVPLIGVSFNFLLCCVFYHFSLLFSLAFWILNFDFFYVKHFELLVGKIYLQTKFDLIAQNHRDLKK